MISGTVGEALVEDSSYVCSECGRGQSTAEGLRMQSLLSDLGFKASVRP